MKRAGRLALLGAVVLVAGAVARPDWMDRLSPSVGGWARNARAVLRLAPVKSIGADAVAETAAPAGVQRPPVSVVLAEVVARATELRLDTIGSVQPTASVALRPRVDSQVVEVPVKDGAQVKAGDVLVRLDSRQIEAQVKQAEAQVAKDKAALEQADRDAARTADLLTRGAGAQINADNARTAAQTARAVLASDQAALDNLRVQQGYYTIVAPFDGRVGVIALKPGAVARQGEAANAITTVNQMSPIYVSFTAPQMRLAELRAAMAAGSAKTFATPQGDTRTAAGKVTFIDNAIDPNTGSITARALFDNADEALWPGQFCNVRVILAVEPDAIVVPREAVMTGQNGAYVFAADGDIARMRAVVLNRVQDDVAVISSGLKPGEKVVVEGQAQLTPDARFVVRKPAGARAPVDDSRNAG